MRLEPQIPSRTRSAEVDNHVRLALFVAMVIGHALPGGAQIDPQRAQVYPGDYEVVRRP